MLADVGNPDLRVKCMEIIAHLKKESEILREEDYKKIGEAAANDKFKEVDEQK